MRNSIHIIVLAMLSMGMMACSGQSASPDQQNTETPTITIEFSASPAIILANEMATLSWSAEGASSCTIPGVFFSGGEKAKGGAALFSSLSKEIPLPDLGGGDAVLPSAGNTGVAPTESTIYTITCTNEDGLSQSATAEIIFSLDADEDGYPDTLEILVGTKSNDPDSDDDGILDGLEDLNRNGLVDGNETDPTNPASRNPYYCDSIRHDNEGDGLDVLSTCINPEKFAAGDRHACLIMDNGLMRCWGGNNFFQLGVSGENIGDDETAAERGISFSGLIQVSARGSTTCALRHSGTVLCWGRGHYGVTGQAHENLQTFAQANVNLPEPAIQVSTSGTHSCAVSVTGSLYCWGRNSFGELGYGNKDDIGDNEHPDSVGPVDIGAPVKQVSTGSGFTCALLVSGQVKCWGVGTQGQIGWEADYAQYEAYPGDQEGETPVAFPFVSLNGGSTYEISSGRHHTCAMSGGALNCWGQGSDGKLGHGNTENLGDDELASDFGAVPYGGGDVTNIATGGAGTCVSLSNGNAKCWGASAFGIGYGNTDTIGDDEPASAGGNLDFDGKRSIYIASGGGFSCALMHDQTVYCWGNNDVGQLGLGNTTPVSNSVLGEVDYR